MDYHCIEKLYYRSKSAWIRNSENSKLDPDPIRNNYHLRVDMKYLHLELVLALTWEHVADVH